MYTVQPVYEGNPVRVSYIAKCCIRKQTLQEQVLISYY